MLARLNFGHIMKEINKSNIAKIPKKDDSDCMEHFRPISLCNVIYKKISKCIANRVRKVIPNLVREEHNSFVPRRHIANNILLAHEVLEYVKKFKGHKSIRWLLRHI